MERSVLGAYRFVKSRIPKCTCLALVVHIITLVSMSLTGRLIVILGGLFHLLYLCVGVCMHTLAFLYMYMFITNMIDVFS